MKRLLVAAGLTAGLLIAGAAPALAHAEFDQERVEANKEIDLVLKVPVEIEGQQNTKVVVEVPKGFSFRNCLATGNWACSVAFEGQQPIITWAPSPGNTVGLDTFQMRVQASATNGPARFEVNQFYSNGDVVHWDNADPDSDNPAPTITVFGGSDAADGGADKASENTGGQVVVGNDSDGESHQTDVVHDGEATIQTEDGAAATGTDVAADDAAEDKDTNYMALYIIIAFWLIVAIPVIVAGTRFKPEAHGHNDHH